MLVVATHRECMEGNLVAWIDALNKELHMLLLPACKDELILYEAPDKVAFVLNLKDPDDKDIKALELIREKVSESNLGRVINVPGSFLIYEQDLLKFAERMHRDILSLEECLEVCNGLKLNAEVVKAALIFFHHHNTFLYFHQVLPNIVFVKPQVPLDLVNAIVRFSYRVSAGELQGFPAKFVSSLQEAIITEEMLGHEELSFCFISGLYEPQLAIKLFSHTFTIATLSHDQQLKTIKNKPLKSVSYSKVPSNCKEYLMMCLLQALPDLELGQHIPTSFTIEPLVVKFTDDCVPLSCFSSTISCLLSEFNWKVSRNVKGTPECLAHNIVSLFSPELPIKVVLVNSTEFLTVYIDADEENQDIFLEVCSEVCKTVFGALEKVFDIMRLAEIEVSPAFLCPCKELSKVHYASHFKVMTKHFLRCSKTNALVGMAQEKHMIWLEKGNESQPQSESDKNLTLPMLMELGVPEQVGNKYKKFGTLLLNDQRGNRIDNIDKELRGNVEEINTKILQDWLNGKGQSVSWETLLDSLRACNLNELANHIATLHT